LKSTAGWYSSGNGKDDYGFHALPGGHLDGTTFAPVGLNGYWWSAAEDSNASYAWYRNMSYYDAYVYPGSNGLKTDGFSLRCLKETP
jgi:uncharacterized protein (TIGR02145 family)